MTTDTFRDTARGMLAMAGSAALVGVTTLIAKVLGVGEPGIAGLHPLQVSAGRFAFALLALLVVIALRPSARPDFVGARWRWHVGRSLCGWLGITSMFAAAARMPLAEATAISFLSPLVTMALAVLLLKESSEIRKWAGAALSMAGALILLQPGTEAFRPSAFLALAAAAFMGTEAIFIKRLSGSEPPLRILLINNAIGATVSALAAATVWTAPAPSQWMLLAALGTVMVSAQALFIQAMRLGDASLVIPVFYMVLVFAAVYDFLLFGVGLSLTALVGAALIVAGALFIALTTPSAAHRRRV
ncbi:DMT family transporter [Rhodobium gokarnense]|uniref:Drug/metabolite transporter (DMT)-like permease n=1 Tax=Rhodobium gokarnense TaxID=364296 RepID=A0ABT3HGL5_9HYPH|nr:DMT family transporter [Rhodobium gokarnense]MCW2309469.1 drug/metabolite transporter (DMT)-like permease [Rhodobium gokarnense]